MATNEREQEGFCFFKWIDSEFGFVFGYHHWLERYEGRWLRGEIVEKWWAVKLLDE